MPADLNGDNQWCFAWPEEAVPTAGKARAAAIKKYLWAPGDMLTISFLDGEKSVHKRVQAAADQWVGPKMANLKLVFQKSTKSLIRISFSGRGSWSVIGNSCLTIDKAKPTMNFGWLSPMTPDDALEAVVLHEFGHALGLIHEHQHPAGKIKWKREQVEADLAGPPHFWTPEKIQRNMFDAYTKKETNFSKFDPQSIMLYPILKTWTTDGFTTIANKKLSATDIAHIRKLYPWT